MRDRPPAAIQSARDIACIKRRAKMQHMAEAGFSITQTALSLGTSRTSVYRFAKSSGVVFRHRPAEADMQDAIHESCRAEDIRIRDTDDYREAIQDMKPIAAVNHLLGLLDGLTHQLPEMSLSPLPGLSLSRLEARLLHHLDRRRSQPVTEEALMFTMYQLRPDQDWPATKIVGVRVCNIRRKLRLANVSGVRIDTCRSVGFCLRVSNGVRLDWRSAPGEGPRP